MSERKLVRPLFCPICGQRVEVETDCVRPEVHRIPDHFPLGSVNLCAAFVVTVSIEHDKCAKCGRDMLKHASGLCQGCYGEQAKGQVTP